MRAASNLVAIKTTKPRPALLAGLRPADPRSALASAKINVQVFLLSKDLNHFRRGLLRWYDCHRRDLPWRKTSDPYRIWLSEIMLQQTRVAAVLDHYRIFIERFPSIEALAAASGDAVLAAWSGLGYYRRARMLHKCAQEIVERHDGCFPRDADALRALPGIGRYTAAAVASIAFAAPTAVADGNVERVLRRLKGINLTTVETWHHAEALLDESRPGDFNQAMMELGATVCVTRKPHCRSCPVHKWCRTQGEILRAVPTPRQAKKQIWCALEWREANGDGRKDDCRKIRLVRRSMKASLMPGMWELPQSSEPPRSLPESARWRTFRHSITVTDYTVHVLRTTPLKRGPLLEPTKGKWIAINHISDLPITGLTRKILKASGII
jgi:A/G-specific adenine glycosylase